MFLSEYLFPSTYLEFLLSIHQVPAKMQLFLLSVSLYLAHWMDSLTLQHLSGYIYVAKHRCSPCYILLHLIVIVHLLPSQSNDEVSEVFVLVEGAEDDPLYYSLER